MTNEDPTITHIYNKIAELKTRLEKLEQKVSTWDNHVKTTISLDWVQKIQSVQENQEQRLRALERKNIKNEGLNHTPLKMSHKFQIDLLSRFLKQLNFKILYDRIVESVFYNIIDAINDLIGNGDVAMRIDYRNHDIVLWCNCSECVRSVDKVECYSCVGVNSHKIDCIVNASNSFELYDDKSTVVKKSVLNYNNEDHGSYICKSCNKRFISEELLYEHNKSEHTVMSATDSGKGMNSDKPTIIINDDPVGITLDRVGNKVISIEFSDLNCGICENEVVSPDNFCIVDNQLFHFDCVIKARNIAGGKIDMQNTERRNNNDIL